MRKPVRRGTAATEFVFVLPLLFLLGLGCFQVSRAIQHYLIVLDAASIGAEYAATHGFTDYTREEWERQVRAAVQEEMEANLNLGSSDPDVLIRIAQDAATDELPLIYVRVSYDSPSVIRWPGLPDAIRLQGGVCVRRYR